MRLVRVELNRFFSRRAVVLLLLAAGLLTALVAGTTVWDTRPVSASDLATAEAQVQQQVSQPGFQKELKRCRANPQQVFGPDATPDDCDRGLMPTVDSYLNRAPLSLGDQLGGGGIAVLVLVTALMIIVGTTFVGADWATGSMSNQVLFEPRRLRVWSAKASAVLLGCALVSALLLAGFWLSLYVVAQTRGISTGGGVLSEVRWTTARGITLAALAGLGGYSLTMLLRSTVASLALVFAYVVGGEALLSVSPFERSGRWSLTNNVFAWVKDGVGVYDQSIACSPAASTCDQVFRLSLLHGAAYLGGLLLLVSVVSALLFRRRDVP